MFFNKLVWYFWIAQLLVLRNLLFTFVIGSVLCKVKVKFHNNIQPSFPYFIWYDLHYWSHASGSFNWGFVTCLNDSVTCLYQCVVNIGSGVCALQRKVEISQHFPALIYLLYMIQFTLLESCLRSIQLGFCDMSQWLSYWSVLSCCQHWYWGMCDAKERCNFTIIYDPQSPIVNDII